VSDPAAIQPLRAEHARPVADLHRQAIPTGFISSLGPAFVTELYRAIASCPHGFGFVSIRGERVTGFVAGALHVGSLYRYILLRRGYRLMVPLARFLVRPGTIRRILQTLLYPARVSADLPKPEILSIAVAADERGRGTAVALMDAAVDELRRRGCPDVKLVVAADNAAANAFYRKTGFELATTIDSHGVPSLRPDNHQQSAPRA
jgi:ribosomal protein S18 acetylase RimI-like enzyme